MSSPSAFTDLGHRTLGIRQRMGQAQTMWIDQHGSEVLERTECFRLLAVAAKEHSIA